MSFNMSGIHKDPLGQSLSAPDRDEKQALEQFRQHQWEHFA